MTYSLVTYSKDQRAPRSGVLFDGLVFDLAELVNDASLSDMRSVLNAWTTVRGQLAQVIGQPRTKGLQLEECVFETPLPNPGAIYCAGANYRDHVVNMARRLKIEPEPDPHTAGLNPWHFIKSSWCVIGSGAQVALDSEFLDWEVELAVVIGRKAKKVAIADAFDYVAGYTIGNDLSARDRTQRPPVAVGSPFRYDWIGQKNFDGACPLGPVIVPAEFVAHPMTLGLRTFVNGVLKQDSRTSEMIFSIAEQLSHLSTRITLHPGDVILTGTPAGTGAESGECLKKGDEIRCEIDGIGALTTLIV